MKIDIRAHGFTLTDGTRQHIGWRLAGMLAHAGNAVSRVVVRLSDINGPRGGVDKRCGVELRLKGAQPLVVEDVQSDLHVAIDRACERIGRSLHRRLMRRRGYPAATVGRSLAVQDAR